MESVPENRYFSGMNLGLLFILLLLVFGGGGFLFGGGILGLGDVAIIFLVSLSFLLTAGFRVKR
jgi:hypothetical protein